MKTDIFQMSRFMRFILPHTNQSFKDPNHPLVKAFIETMKSVYPWQVLYIYDKRVVEFDDSLIKLSEVNNIKNKTDL